MISEIGAGQKICLQARYEKAQDADPTTTICRMPVVRTATFYPKPPEVTVGSATSEPSIRLIFSCHDAIFLGSRPTRPTANGPSPSMT